MRAAHAAWKGTLGAASSADFRKPAFVSVANVLPALHAGKSWFGRREPSQRAPSARMGAPGPRLSLDAFHRGSARSAVGGRYRVYPTSGGFLYLAVVLDALGAAGSSVVDGDSCTCRWARRLNMALCGQRRPAAGDPPFGYSGSQYASISWQTMSRGRRSPLDGVGGSHDNAMAESFFATLECELLDRRRFKTQAEARMAVFDWLRASYDPAGDTHARLYLCTQRVESDIQPPLSNPGTHMPSCSRPSRSSLQETSQQVAPPACSHALTATNGLGNVQARTKF